MNKKKEVCKGLWTRVLGQERSILDYVLTNSMRRQQKTVMIERIKFSKEHITNKMKENRSRRIIKVTQQIKSNVDNGGKIWEVKRKIQRKKQTPDTIKDEKTT